MGYEKVKQYCHSCDGTGILEDCISETCSNCNGKGHEKGLFGGWQNCSKCGGSGNIYSDAKCGRCEGRGRIVKRLYRCDTCRGFKNVDQYEGVEQCSCPIEEDYNDNIVDRSDW